MNPYASNLRHMAKQADERGDDATRIVLESAAKEIDRLCKLAGDIAEQWANCEADRSPDDWRWFGPCQLMKEGLALKTNS